MKQLFFLFVTATLFSFKPVDWKLIKLTEKVQVSMPADPVDETVNGMTLKKFKAEDGSQFAGMVIDLSTMGMTAEQVKEALQSTGFKDQIKLGMESQGSKIIAESEGEFNGMKYYQFDLETTKEGKTSKSTVRAVFSEALMIQLIYKHSTVGIVETMREQFFNSLKILG